MKGQQEDQRERYAQPRVQRRAVTDRQGFTENEDFTQTEHTLGVKECYGTVRKTGLESATLQDEQSR